MSSIFGRSAVGFLLCALGAATVQTVTAAGPVTEKPPIAICRYITTAAQLQAMSSNLAGTYCLGRDIDASSIANFVPVGNTPSVGGSAFIGRLYGRGHIIRNLTISGTDPNGLGGLGLFGAIGGGASISDLGLVDVQVNGPGESLGALVGSASGAAISNVYSTGQINCTDTLCASSGRAGGLIGLATNNMNVSDAWSSADVATIGPDAGGLIGFGLLGAQSYLRVHATGNVSGASLIGGLAGLLTAGGTVKEAYATGEVSCATGANCFAVGGLIGSIQGGETVISSYATGPVMGSGTTGGVGGLIGYAGGSANLTDVFSVGFVTADAGQPVGGLVGAWDSTVSSANAYWDTVTSNQATSVVGSPQTTTDLRGGLQFGDNTVWGITQDLSYPFLDDANSFSSTLATLVSATNNVFTFLPIGQFDTSQYAGTPMHADTASLGAVFTMIARAVGITDGVDALQNVKIDTYFWNDATQIATFTGPVRQHVTLGASHTIPAGTPLDDTNVIGQMNQNRLVILRGSYTKSDGSIGKHFMLGTLYTLSGTDVASVVANDPWTGTQVEIDPAIKQVVTPNFPLADFTVNAYRKVTALD